MSETRVHFSDNKRICVIGCPGSGKSTFAKKLSEKMGLPIIYVDMHYHDRTKPYYQGQDHEAWLQKVMELTQGDAWMFEGDYRKTYSLRFAAADKILLLDFPRALVLSRIARRRWRYRKGTARTRLGMPDDWEENIDRKFLKLVWNFKKERIPHVAAIADETDSRHKILRFTSPKQLNRFLQTLDESLAGQLKI